MRSARGLNKGEIQVSYDAPFAGEMRIGLTDHIEARYTNFALEENQVDFFLHTHKDPTAINYGLSVGLFGGEVENDALFFHGVISKGVNYRFIPYLGLTFSPKEVGYMHAGAEITLLMRPNYLIQVTPEIMIHGDILTNKEPLDLYNGDYRVIGVLGLGVRFNFLKE